MKRSATEESIELMRRAQTLLQQGQTDDAISMFRQLIQLNRNNPESQYWLGAALLQANKPLEAAPALEKAVRLQPALSMGWKLLAVALAGDRSRVDAASAAHTQAVARLPNDPAVHCNFGTFLLSRGDLDHAIVALRRAVALQPNYSLALQNLASALIEVGQSAEGIELQHRAVQLAPAEARFGSNLLLNLHYLANVSPQEMFDQHVAWGKRHATAPFPRSTFRQSADPHRKLRVGYVSPDFRRHAVPSFLQNIFVGHARSRFAVWAYSNTSENDDITDDLRAMTDGWRSIVSLDDEDAARLILDDQIDLLVDLAGHTNGNRAPLLSRGAAPVQFTYLGYPDTTGVPGVGYRLTDAIADPPGQTDAFCSERLVRLPGCFLCYKPEGDAPAPAAQTPAISNGFITFGSFNNFAKITDTVLDCWAAIVRNTPNSRMIFKARALSSSLAKQRVIDAFARHAVPADRLQFVPWVAYEQRHAIVSSCDIALDPFPYNGTTTTCETLWLGVPCVTLCGQTHVSRVTASILTAVQHAELITKSLEEYSALAIDLANDLQRLNAYRSQLRNDMQNSPLMTRDHFVSNLEAAYRDAWHGWCDAARES